MRVDNRISVKMSNMALLCAVLVVFIHNFLGGYANGWWHKSCFLVSHGLANIAVPYFFLASGYFLAKHGTEVGWWRRESVKRLRTLVVPFFIWNMLYILFHALFVSLTNVVSGRPLTAKWAAWLSSEWIRLLGFDFTDTPANNALWYLRCLFVFVLCSRGLMWGVERFKGWFVLALYLVYIVYGVVISPWIDPDVSKFFIYGFSIRGCFYFAGGMLLAKVGFDWMSWWTAMLAGVLAVCGLVVLGCCWPNGEVLVVRFQFLLVPLMLYSCWYFMPSRATVSFGGGGGLPMRIYCLHRFFILVCCGLCIKYRGFGLSMGTMYFFATFVIVVLCMLVAVGMKRCFPNFDKIAFGGRG